MICVNLLHFYCFLNRKGRLIKQSKAHVFIRLFGFLFLLFLFLFRWKENGSRQMSTLQMECF